MAARLPLKRHSLTTVAAFLIATAESCSAAANADSPVPSGGGRTLLGYTAVVDTDQAYYNNKKLFKRMSGVYSYGTLRSAAEAFDGGSGYHGPVIMLGNLYSTLCPAPVAVFPNSNPGTREGWGCVIFDTYVDDNFPPLEMLVRTGGGAGISNIRLLRNAYGVYGIGFNFDNRSGSGADMRLIAAKVRGNTGNSGIGPQMDGDGTAPNGDDLEWNF